MSAFGSKADFLTLTETTGFPYGQFLQRHSDERTGSPDQARDDARV